MAAAVDTINVCHISPLHNTKGGITTVVTSYAESTDWPVQCSFVESHRDGSRAQKLVHMLRAFKQALQLCLTRRIDIVQVHVGDFPSVYRKMLVTLPFFTLSRCRHILHMHGAAFLTEYAQQNGFSRWLVRWYIAQFDLVIALSEQWQTDLQQHFTIRDTLVLPNAVEVPALLPARDPSQSRIFVFLGLIGARKGIFNLLQSLRDLAVRGSWPKLRIGGNGEVNRLKATLAEYGLEDNVEYLGWLSGAARSAVMETSHVLILPSYAEGAPMSVIEGMSAGMPIISTRVGALPEMVEDGASGFLVEPGDMAGLADAIERLNTDSALWERMSRRSHQIAVERFSLTAHKRTLLGVYQSLLRARPADRVSEGTSSKSDALHER